MALNPQYEAIGKGFVQQYYALFDDPAQRPSLVNMYNVCILKYATEKLKDTVIVWFQVESSFMTFEGVQLQGSVKILEKLTVKTLFF